MLTEREREREREKERERERKQNHSSWHRDPWSSFSRTRKTESQEQVHSNDSKGLSPTHPLLATTKKNSPSTEEGEDTVITASRLHFSSEGAYLISFELQGLSSQHQLQTCHLVSVPGKESGMNKSVNVCLGCLCTRVSLSSAKRRGVTEGLLMGTGLHKALK